VVGALVVTGVAGCVSLTARSQSGRRDGLVGWFKLQGGDRIIPVFKTEGTFYSVCRGGEVPFKECPEGLEWALTPSSMAGTKIVFDEASSNPYYIIIEDEQLEQNCDFYIPGEKRPMTRIDKPSGLLDARAKRPRTIDDFLGWHQLVWFPYVRCEIRKDGEKYVFTTQHSEKPGVWKTEGEPRELTPLPDGLGFTGFDRKNESSLTYNEALKRFELTEQRDKRQPAVIRMPLARIPPPPSPEGGAAPPSMEIGIPAWH